LIRILDHMIVRQHNPVAPDDHPGSKAGALPCAPSGHEKAFVHGSSLDLAGPDHGDIDHRGGDPIRRTHDRGAAALVDLA
jgi:hypothetical protein